ncbi:MAG TPA: hypothetical protein VFW01_04880 [bacterium]|nr:hypothetical protein [bacterium]
MTGEARELRSILGRVALRLSAGAAYRVLARSAALAAAALLVLGLVTLVVPLAVPWGRAGGVVGAGLAAAFPTLLWRRRPSILVAARATDRRLGLADRLGTAVDLLARPVALTGLARLQVINALESARAVTPRTVAPLRIPRDAWIAVALAASLVLWVQYLSGLTLPATPAARIAAAIHREGSRLIDLGRRIDEAARTRGLPEARRVAPQIVDIGQRLTGPRVTREGATGLLNEAGRTLAAARDTVDRRLGAPSTGRPGTGDARTPVTPEVGAQRLEKLDAAVREIDALTSHLRAGSPDQDREAVSQRLRALSESLDRSGDAPAASRRSVAEARRDVEQGRPSAAADALGEALQDLQKFERMLGDEQVLAAAQREIQRSSERIAESGLPGEHMPAAGQAGQAPSDAPRPVEPGSAAPIPGADEVAPPPPGPNQGSLPGEGTGGTRGAPTPRLEGTRTPTHLRGVPGEGAVAVREITAAGQAGAAHLPATRPPADVAHEIDRALRSEPLPPAYLTIIRRYFEILGGAP